MPVSATLSIGATCQFREKVVCRGIIDDDDSRIEHFHQYLPPSGGHASQRDVIDWCIGWYRSIVGDLCMLDQGERTKDQVSASSVRTVLRYNIVEGNDIILDGVSFCFC